MCLFGLKGRPDAVKSPTGLSGIDNPPSVPIKESYSSGKAFSSITSPCWWLSLSISMGHRYQRDAATGSPIVRCLGSVAARTDAIPRRSAWSAPIACAAGVRTERPSSLWAITLICVDSWTDVAFAEEVPDGKAVRVVVRDQPVLLLRSGDDWFSISNQCTHQGAGLDRGVVRIAGSVKTVTCPAHGSMFNLETGKPMRPPATKPVPVYDVKVEDGRVFVRPRAEG